MQVFATNLLRIVVDLLGQDYLDHLPKKHPASRILQTLSSEVWTKGSRNFEFLIYEAKQLGEYSLLAVAFAELFNKNKQLRLDDLTKFAGESYSVHLRKRARDPNDFKSVISEIWVANLFVQRNFQLLPIQRKTIQADFECIGPDQFEFQIECKIASVDDSVQNLKNKITKANIQLKSDPLQRPGLLVMHFCDAGLVDDLTTDAEPLEISRQIDIIKKLINGEKFRSISQVMCIWDDEFEKPSVERPWIYNYIISRNAIFLAHPFARKKMPPNIFPNDFGMSIHIEMDRIIKFPRYTVASGAYSINRVYSSSTISIFYLKGFTLSPIRALT